MVSFKQLSVAGAAVLAIAPQTFAAPISQSSGDEQMHLIARYIVESAPSEALERWIRSEVDLKKPRPTPSRKHTLRRDLYDEDIELESRGEGGLPPMPSLKEANAGVRYVGPTPGKPKGHIVPAPKKARPVPKKAKTMRRDLYDEDIELESRGEGGLPPMPSLKEANAGVRYVGPTPGKPKGHIVPAPKKARPVPKKAKTMRRGLFGEDAELESRGEGGLPPMPSLKEANAGVRYVGPTPGRPKGHIVPAPKKARPVPKKAKTI